MAENNTKIHESGAKGLGVVKNDVVAPSLKKLSELSLKLRSLTEDILSIKENKIRAAEEKRLEEERMREEAELQSKREEEERIKREEAEKAATEKENEKTAVALEKEETAQTKPVEEASRPEPSRPAAPAREEKQPVVQTRIFTNEDRKPRDRQPNAQQGAPNRQGTPSQNANFNRQGQNGRPQQNGDFRKPLQNNNSFARPKAGATPPPPAANAANKGFKGNAAPAKKTAGQNDDKKAQNKKSLIKRGFIVENDAYYTEEEGDAGATGRYIKKRPKKNGFNITETVTIDKAVITTEFISIKQLSEKIGKTGSEILKQLMLLGIMKTINDVIDFDTADLVAGELGVTLSYEPEKTAEDKLQEIRDEDDDSDADKVSRPPIITIMGHVDHGKTSLLDYIRKSSVASGEAGGITQHIGAYTVSLNGRNITFLDTPGHEAFTSMRLRGALVTDIAVIVVAADDGIMPQTVEAINHAKTAGVSIIVAVNKIDKPGAQPDRVLQQLTEYDLVPEAWGGTTPVVNVSAKTGQGVNDLLETILLVADILELKANPNRAAKGSIIEAKLDKGKGPLATVLVQNGTLHVGDYVVAGTCTGKIRGMIDDKGKNVKSAGPSVPVSVLGFSEVPNAGDPITAVSDEKFAKQVVSERIMKMRNEMNNIKASTSLDDIFAQIKKGETKTLNIIIKADVQGSVEAVKQSLEKLSNDEVKISVIHGAVGAINESDVMLASTSGAIIIGFNVRPDAKAKVSAERANIDIRLYRVIYDAIDDVNSAIKGMLAPKFRENILGNAEVRQVYRITGAGTVAGCYVTDGKIQRNAKVRLYRDDTLVYEGELSSLKRFKDDVKEVAKGYECGMGILNYNDIKEGDFIEAYVMEQIQ